MMEWESSLNCPRCHNRRIWLDYRNAGDESQLYCSFCDMYPTEIEENMKIPKVICPHCKSEVYPYIINTKYMVAKENVRLNVQCKECYELYYIQYIIKDIEK
jgi:hypothetical protein